MTVYHCVYNREISAATMWKSTALNSCPIPSGILVIIGGKEDKGIQVDNPETKDQNERLEILKAFVKLTGKDKAVVEVITTASGSGDELFEDYKRAFGELGVPEPGHIHHKLRGDVLQEDLTDRLQNADAFFFTGGDQLLLTSIYGGTSFLTKLKERYIHEKIVIGGTSAGAMAMSTPMIYAGNKSVQQIAGEIKVTMGLEFLKDVCIDTHFIDRSRFVRMAQVIATNPTCIGIGIEEDTGIVITDGVNAEVVGTGVVTVIEGFNLSSSNITDIAENCPVYMEDLKVHLLARGGKYEIPQINPPHK
ncbi:MAG: cyanophycinase [Ferruginibacter sp.]|nr:cyanophycinase [Ferruginibacter sp.]